ncbi:hypothetical protein WK07_22660 [Burkholderia multivorans]|nr:hypothetical protein WK07_22660 [Burkholderia multivorans]
MTRRQSGVSSVRQWGAPTSVFYCIPFQLTAGCHVGTIGRRASDNKILIMTTISKLDVATELLTQALRLFLEGKAYFAALNLAGAAEEVFGKFVEEHGGVPALHNMRDVALHFAERFRDEGDEYVPLSKAKQQMADLINHAKNTTKHRITDVDFDPKEEAQDLLDRAVDNYSWLKLRLNLSAIDLMNDYLDARHRKPK